MAKKKTSSKKRASEQEALESVVSKGERADSGTALAKLVQELDEKQKVARFQEWFRYANEQTEEWRENYIENQKFLSGDQWSDEDKAKLRKQKRPALVINRVTSIMQTLSGLQRKARTEIDLLPPEPDDIASAEIMELLVKHVRDKNRINALNSRTFEDKAGSGLGFRKIYYSFDKRPQGEIKVERLSPLSIFWDPNYPDATWQDAQWVMHSEWLALDEAIEEWPEFEDQIRTKYGEWVNPIGAGASQGELAGDSHASRRAFWDPQTQRLRLLQIWYKLRKKVEIAVFSDGEVEGDPEKVKEIKKAVSGLSKEEKGLVTFVKRPVVFVRVAHLLDDILLDDQESPLPFDEFPLVPSLGYYYWEKPVGLIDFMKDPQREKNKRRTAITEIAGRTAHSGWKNKRAGGASREDLENHANGSGAIVEYDEVEPKEIRPPELSQVLVMLEDRADREIKEVVNINEEVLGQRMDSSSSGRAIEARQRGALITQEPLFDTFADEEVELTKLMIEMIKDNINEEEAMRILGSLVSDDPQASQLGELSIDDLRLALSRAFSLEYDVVITNKPFDASSKQAAFGALLDMRQQGIPVPDDLVVDGAIDAGVIAKPVGERIKQYLFTQQQQQAVAQGQQSSPSDQLIQPPTDTANVEAQTQPAGIM